MGGLQSGRLQHPSARVLALCSQGRLYFISRRDPERGQDPEDLLPHEALYWAKVGDSTVKPVGFFSSKHEGIAGFVGDTLIVYRSARHRGGLLYRLPFWRWVDPARQMESLP